MKRNIIILSVILFLFSSFISAQEENFKTVTVEGKDGIDLTADVYSIGNKSAPTVLLFHQYKSSRGEYREIAPILNDMGFNAIAFDTRAGGTDPWSNVENVTSKTYADVFRDYLAVYPELETALDYALKEGYDGKIIVWGSSFSASLVLKLAAENPDKISGVLAFSPGEYMKENKGIVSKWAGEIKDIPVFISCGARESDNVKPIYEKIKAEDKTFYLPAVGNHGSSILMDDSRNWKEAKAFLKKFLAQ
ncbi:MAG: alpha/beta fold hydrolase [Chlorobi bacterium]|nr:alpha/beta fold hydrolase [Chlorobiota bacterium]